MRTNAEAYEIFVPGLLVLLAIFGGLFQGFGLIAELRAGVIERSRVTPVSRLALLLGRSLRDVVSLLAQAVIITLLALLFGLRVFIGDLLLAYLMLALISLMTSAVSLRRGAGGQERGRAGAADEHGGPAGAAAVRHPAAADVRARLAAGRSPTGTRSPGRSNGTRALFRGDLGAPGVWQGLLIMAVLAVLALIWAAREFARSVR